MLFRNTFMIAFNNLVFFFPLPVILALMLNSVVSQHYKRIVQTITYMPHFLSWVIICKPYICNADYRGRHYQRSCIRLYRAAHSLSDGPALFPKHDRHPVNLEGNGLGYDYFLAALSNVDPQLYDAAHVDGANGWQRMIYITLPAISGTIVTLLILRLGHFLDTGFTQLFLMINA
jgi:putative aldouronate transport system permease protein